MYLYIGTFMQILFCIISIFLLFYKKGEFLINIFNGTYLEQGLDLLHNINKYKSYNEKEIILGCSSYILTIIILSFIITVLYPIIIILCILYYYMNKRIKQRKQF